jgi:hypothetical protein
LDEHHCQRSHDLIQLLQAEGRIHQEHQSLYVQHWQVKVGRGGKARASWHLEGFTKSRTARKREEGVVAQVMERLA